MGRGNTVIFTITAAILLIGQAYVNNMLYGFLQSSRVTNNPTNSQIEIQAEVYKTQVDNYRTGIEFDSFKEILNKYSGTKKLDKSKLIDVILRESEKYGIEPMLVFAIIETESTFRSWASSNKGAKGLMQIRPFVGKAIANELGLPWEGDKTLLDPYTNVQMGIYYFAELIDIFDNDINTALTAYNYGPSFVKRLLKKQKNIPVGYASRVFNKYGNLSNIHATQKDRFPLKEYIARSG
jgi:soluble lytic murein transglycosylase-like protein